MNAKEKAGVKKASVTLSVPFHDLDPMKIVWHGNYLKYFEIARQKLFEEIGCDLYDFHLQTGYLFPIIRTTVKHIHPLRFKDEFICEARLTDARRKVTVEFEIRLVEGGKVCARGRSEQVAVRSGDLQMEFEIPEEFRRALGF